MKIILKSNISCKPWSYSTDWNWGVSLCWFNTMSKSINWLSFSFYEIL